MAISQSFNISNEMWKCAVQRGTDLCEQHAHYITANTYSVWFECLTNAWAWARAQAYTSNQHWRCVCVRECAKSITNKTASTHRLIGFKIKMQTHSVLPPLIHHPTHSHLPNKCRAYFYHSHFFYILGLLVIVLVVVFVVVVFMSHHKKIFLVLLYAIFFEVFFFSFLVDVIFSLLFHIRGK